MNKVLFVSFALNASNNGGAAVSKRNYCSLCDIFGFENVDILSLQFLPNKSIKEKITKNIAKLFYKTEFKEVWHFDFTKFKQFNIIFLDASQLGVLAEKLYKNCYLGKIICYFHNCEYDYYQQMMSGTNWFVRHATMKYIFFNEKKALQYSSVSIAINSRDQARLMVVYKKAPKYIIPVCLEDRYTIQHVELESKFPKKTYVFIGSAFYANINGITWFIKNVYPFVSIRLQIIGKGMNILKSIISESDIEIYDDVDDLSPFINNADYMVYPIFEGSGMKVKTCEALMYGKSIIGTIEAFEGYDTSNIRNIGAICNTDKEFINTINANSAVKSKKFNHASRSLFLEKYSYEISNLLYKKIFEQINN